MKFSKSRLAELNSWWLWEVKMSRKIVPCRQHLLILCRVADMGLKFVFWLNYQIDIFGRISSIIFANIWKLTLSHDYRICLYVTYVMLNNLFYWLCHILSKWNIKLFKIRQLARRTGSEKYECKVQFCFLEQDRLHILSKYQFWENKFCRHSA